MRSRKKKTLQRREIILDRTEELELQATTDAHLGSHAERFLASIGNKRVLQDQRIGGGYVWSRTARGSRRDIRVGRLFLLNLSAAR